MEIRRHEDVEKDLRKLRKFQAARESLEAWEKLFVLKGLHETPAIEPFDDFGKYKVYKARVVPLKEKFGKSKGYRVVFTLVNDLCTILVFTRHGIYHDEGGLIELVKSRLDLQIIA